MLFFIHVPWKWIKQRPHFFAEELSKTNDIIVVERFAFSKKYWGHKSDIVNVRTLFQLPKERYPIIHFINKFILSFFWGNKIKKTEFIWLTSPIQYSYLESFKYKGKIIYDCMDDLLEFEKTELRREKLRTQEETLLKNADLVIASSLHLKKTLVNRYGQNDIIVVNNAIKDNIEPRCPQLPQNIQSFFDHDKKSITYIGTISSWFDFNLMKKVLDDNDNTVLNLFGPKDTGIPKDERIRYCGTIPHDMVFSVMKQSDILIMPFVLNDLILSVNPVKLYEYIFSGKPCIAPLYGESKAFSDYVYLYDSASDCSKIVGDIVNGKIASKRCFEECRAYALANTWSERVKQISKSLKDLK